MRSDGREEGFAFEAFQFAIPCVMPDTEVRAVDTDHRRIARVEFYGQTAGGSPIATKLDVFHSQRTQPMDELREARTLQ